MGVLFSRFWRKKTALQKLEEIEETINLIEEYSSNVEQRYRTVGRALVSLSATLFLFGCSVLYFRAPRNSNEVLIFSATLLVSFLATIFLRRIMSWYYNRKINKNKTKLTEIRKKKKEIIEEVMAKETYNTAKEILERFAPPSQQQSYSHTIVRSTPQPYSSVTRRVIAPGLPAPVRTTQQAPSQTNPVLSAVNRSDTRQAIVPYYRQSSRPFLDGIFEYLIGEGPTNRYALICTHCQTHNGMALKEEFPYLSFRCCSCQKLNPARKLRPSPPRLPVALDSKENGIEEDTIDEGGSDTSVENHDDETPLVEEKQENVEAEEGETIAEESVDNVDQAENINEEDKFDTNLATESR